MIANINLSKAFLNIGMFSSTLKYNLHRQVTDGHEEEHNQHNTIQIPQNFPPECLLECFDYF